MPRYCHGLASLLVLTWLDLVQESRLQLRVVGRVANHRPDRIIHFMHRTRQVTVKAGN
jgi:hypothetical protein